MDQVGVAKGTERLVKRREQIDKTLRRLEDERQAVERKVLSMDPNARKHRLELLGYLVSRYTRHLAWVERMLERTNTDR